MNSIPAKGVAGQKSLRSACDLCHQGKVKCSGGTPCDGCDRLGVRCIYSTSNRTGRPKGVKNKKTLERIKQLRAANLADNDSPSSQFQVTYAQNSRRASKERDCDEQLGKTSPAKSPSQSVDQANQGDNSSHFWDFLPMSDNGQQESNFTPFLSDPGLSDPPASPPSLPSTSLDLPNYTPPDLTWIDSILSSSDATLSSSEIDQLQTNIPGTNGSASAYTPDPSSIDSLNRDGLPHFACNCVQKLTEQLANFKALSRSSHLVRPDFVLTVARDALSGWQGYLSCRSCHVTNDKDVLVLLVMALRALLNLIKEAAHQSLPTEGEDKPAVQDLSPQTNPDNSFLGTYRLACEERRLVVDLLLQRTLKNLNHTTEQLRKKSLQMAGNRSKAGSMSSQSSRSQSSISTPSTSTNLFLALEDPADTSDLNFSVDSITLDEHDNYLQESLQSSMVTIEALMAKARIPPVNYDPCDAQMIIS